MSVPPHKKLIKIQIKFTLKIFLRKLYGKIQPSNRFLSFWHADYFNYLPENLWSLSRNNCFYEKKEFLTRRGRRQSIHLGQAEIVTHFNFLDSSKN